MFLSYLTVFSDEGQICKQLCLGLVSHKGKKHHPQATGNRRIPHSSACLAHLRALTLVTQTHNMQACTSASIQTGQNQNRHVTSTRLYATSSFLFFFTAVEAYREGESAESTLLFHRGQRLCLKDHCCHKDVRIVSKVVCLPYFHLLPAARVT